VFEQMNIVGQPLILSQPSEVRDAESRLGIRFPSGYREFVTRFGEGTLGGSYIRIYPPHRILFGINNVTEWRERINEFWFWDVGRAVLTKEQVLQSVIIGDTLNGDELIIHPSNSERVYVLPRDKEDIFVAGDGLPAAIEWLCASGILTARFKERDFAPFDIRQQDA